MITVAKKEDPRVKTTLQKILKMLLLDIIMNQTQKLEVKYTGMKFTMLFSNLQKI